MVTREREPCSIKNLCPSLDRNADRACRRSLGSPVKVFGQQVLKGFLSGVLSAQGLFCFSLSPLPVFLPAFNVSSLFSLQALPPLFPLLWTLDYPLSFSFPFLSGFCDFACSSILLNKRYLRSYLRRKVQSGGEKMSLLKIKQVFPSHPCNGIKISREETEAQSLNL